MFGPLDFVLGAVVPLLGGAAALALAWRVTHRAGAAWSAGVVAGFVAGCMALEIRDSGLTTALVRLVRPSEALDRMPLAALLAALPALVAAVVGRRWVEWPLAVVTSLAAFWWLLAGKYRAIQQLREAGFADEGAITPAGAAAVLVALVVALLAAWRLWRGAAEAPLVKTRSLLAIAAVVGAALAAALTGSLAYGQTFGVLAATLGGCAAAAWMLGVRAGPEAAPGPVLVSHAGLLSLAAAYSSLPWMHAALLGVALVAAAGWLNGLGNVRPAWQIAARAAFSLALVGAVVGVAAAQFAENEQQPAALDEPYFR